MNDFAKELEAAKSAAAELIRIKNLEKTAARLPEFVEKAELQKRVKEAGVSLDEAERRARRILENAKPIIAQARQRFEDGLAECLAALDDLQPIQDEIKNAAANLWEAVSETVSLENASDDGGFWGRPFGASTASVNAAFGRHWGQIGGLSPDLDFMPDNPDRVALAILRASQTAVYQTKGGAGLYYKHR